MSLEHFLSDLLITEGDRMSKIKQFAEKVSIELGYDGEINEEVLKEADRRLKEYLGLTKKDKLEMPSNRVVKEDRRPKKDKK
jgi:hypothetical protein